ncbi:thermitase [Armatimonadetes bacterium GBS]|nr:thermitase [Armatimonadetes bacterium GBS]
MSRMRWLFGIALLWSVWAIGIAQVVAEPVDVASWLDDPKVEYVPNELIVGVDLEKGVALAQVAMEFVGTVQDYNASIGAYVVRLAPHISMKDAYEFLRNLPGVSYVEPNYIYHAIATPNDPYYAQQWALPKIQANWAWDLWTPRAVVYVAIIDTGVDYNHSDLVNKFRRTSSGAVYGWNTLRNNSNANDDNGHGTHVAGIAAAQINNGVGVAGVAAWNPAASGYNAYVQIMPVKVLGASGSGSLSSIANGITWAVNNGADVLNLSLGGSSGSQTLANAVAYAWNAGCLIVAAAGNSGSSPPQYPAYYTTCIAVAATDSSDRLASFSQYGSWVDIAAPGVSILSTYYRNRYAYMDGTSMACPHVAGAAALVWSNSPWLTNQQLRSILETNVDPYSPYGTRTIAPGAGRLNVYRALQAAN